MFVNLGEIARRESAINCSDAMNVWRGVEVIKFRIVTDADSCDYDIINCVIGDIH